LELGRVPEYLNRGPIRPALTTGLGRVAGTKQTIHIVDTKAEQAYADREPWRMATVVLGGARGLLNVPMLNEDELIGAPPSVANNVRRAMWLAMVTLSASLMSRPC